MHPVRLFCWHFMAYPHLPADFDDARLEIMTGCGHSPHLEKRGGGGAGGGVSGRLKPQRAHIGDDESG